MTSHKLNGKVVLITGASAGIGQETALELAKYKVKIIIAARRKSRLEELARKIMAQGSEVLVVPTDLTDIGQITNLVGSSIKRFGRIDFLLNIAGWGVYKWFEEFTFEEIDDQFRVNVMGLIELTRQVIPIMKEQRSGHIINMSSYASRIVFPPLTIYSSTKYAIEGLTDGLRRELLPWGIKVSRVHPSAVSGTEFNQKSEDRGGVEYKSLSIGRIKKQFVARRIIDLMIKPSPSLFLGRLYDVPVFFNNYLPKLVDLVAFWWVKRKRKI